MRPRLLPLCVLFPLGLPGLGACRELGAAGTQSTVLAHLVVHVDPLAREGGLDCARGSDPALQGLSECGTPVAESWRQRSQNLGWLSERWLTEDRAVDVQIGPEMGLAWAEDPELVLALVRDLVEDGVAEADARVAVAETARDARAALARLLDAGVGSLGAHTHSVLPDQAGAWGNAPKGGGGEGPDACGAGPDDPLASGAAATEEAVVAYGVAGAAAVALLLDSSLETYTGHLPRTMAGKIQVVRDPDAIDPSEDRVFDARFRPRTLGSAYSECLLDELDHPPFEAWPADDASALARGSGPPVIPGDRVVGSMDEHLGSPTDGAAGAVQRRVLQLMLNWRYAGLSAARDRDTGDAPNAPGRPWVWTFHTHLFHLNPGTVAALDPAARDANTRNGVPLRGDLEGAAAFVDSFAALRAWQGVSGPEGAPPLRWALPLDLPDEDDVIAGSQFSWIEAEGGPYLPLVSERLAQSHLVCQARVEGVEIFGLHRCAGGWAWGDPGPGFTCVGGVEPEEVYVLVPEAPTCLPLPPGMHRAGAVDDAALGAPAWCGEALEIPVQGLIVEPAARGWLAGTCG